MSRLEVPIKGRTLFATGDVLLWIELDLLLKDAVGSWQAQPFRLDTGAEMTTMSAFEAKQLGLPMPRHATRGAVHVQTGLTFRSGYLRFQIVGMDQTEYVVPCLFLGDPDAPPTRRGPRPGRGISFNPFSSWIGSVSRSIKTSRPDRSTESWLWRRDKGGRTGEAPLRSGKHAAAPQAAGALYTMRE
jgi:hypothetical protein